MTDNQREQRNLNPTPEAVLATFLAIETGEYPRDAMDYWDSLDFWEQRVFRMMTAKIIRAWKGHRPRPAGARRAQVQNQLLVRVCSCGTEMTVGPIGHKRQEQPR